MWKEATRAVLGYSTYRQEPVRDLAAFPQVSARIPEDINPQDAPQPVQRGRFWNIGRDAQHAWPMRQVYQSLAIPEWLGVAGWPFSQVGKAPPGSVVVASYVGGQNALGTRANIRQPNQIKLGDLSAVQPGPPPLDISYRKLMG